MQRHRLLGGAIALFLVIGAACGSTATIADPDDAASTGTGVDTTTDDEAAAPAGPPPPDDGAGVEAEATPPVEPPPDEPPPDEPPPADDEAPTVAPPDLEDGVERTDYLTFAQGAVPVEFGIEGPGQDLRSSTIMQAIDGLRTPRTFVSLATDATTVEMTFELPALTAFDRLAVPEISEVPGPGVTFFREIEVLGSPDGAEYERLAAGTLETHDSRGQVTELTVESLTPVRYVRLRLGGGIEILQDESGFEFSELIGNGTQEPVARVDGFTGIWDAKLPDIDRSIGLIELKQDGVVVTGCFGSNDLSGTVTGNIARMTGIDRFDGTMSAYIVGLTRDGALQGVASFNGGPFGFIPSVVAPEGSTTDCTDIPEPEYAFGCGSLVYGINFDFDSANLRPDSEPVLQQLFEGLVADDAASIVVEGHTSTEGSDGYNLDLSSRRAQAVVDDLVERGIDPARIAAAGRGESEPLIAPDDDEAARSINRRVEIDCG